jgi:hypothetical protein
MSTGGNSSASVGWDWTWLIIANQDLPAGVMAGLAFFENFLPGS